MNVPVENLIDAALQLSVDDRMELANALLSSLDAADPEPLDAEWLAEIERRSAEVDAGAAIPFSWEEFKRLARRELVNQVETHRLVSEDYADAYAFYAARSRKAAAGFESEFWRVTKSIIEFPESFPPLENTKRYGRLRKYPFKIIFRHQPGKVVILALAHAKRTSDFWRTRDSNN